MGYYASYDGEITTIPMTQKQVQNLLCAIYSDNNNEERYDIPADFTKAPVPDTFECWKVKVQAPVPDRFDDWKVKVLEKNRNTNTTSYEIGIWGDEKYYEDEVYQFLKAIAPFTTGGEIEYIGEDGEAWRFHFRNGSWYEDRGRIVYDDSMAPIK